jgi:hypothetical protein
MEPALQEPFYRVELLLTPSFYGIPQLLRNSKRGFMRCTKAQWDQRRETCATILVIEDERLVRDRGAHDRACHRQSERGIATRMVGKAHE